MPEDTEAMVEKTLQELKARLQDSSDADTTDVPENDTGSPDDVDIDLSDLFVFLQSRDWEKVYGFLKEHPNSSLKPIQSEKGSISLLQIVLRHGPPLHVVDVLLMQEASRPASLTTVFKQTDTNGRLPLHTACCCGPSASLDVVSRLISVDPDALQVPTKDQHGRYPLHLAVVTNASEEVVMELMVHYPDASFQPDLHGKLPIEYAQDACYGHNRLVVALEWAPMFLAASQAAIKRVAMDTEEKLESLREAHASYEEQLETRYHNEKTELIKEQIRCNNELTDEKERNIAMAEAILDMKETEETLLKEKNHLESKLEQEILTHRANTKQREEDLRQILLGKYDKVKGENDDDDTKAGEDPSESSLQDSFSSNLDASSSKLPLPRLLKRISAGYESSKRRNKLYKESLDRQRNIAKNLNQLLANKENDLRQEHRKCVYNEIALQEAVERAEDLSQKHQSVLEELATAKTEIERLKEIGTERENRYSHSQRRLEIQKKRLSGVQDLIDSFKAISAQAAEQLDFVEEDELEQESVCPIFEAGTSPLANKSRGDADFGVPLAVEIDMSAVGPSELEDDSVFTSPSARREAANLSAELAETDAEAKTPEEPETKGRRYSSRNFISPEHKSKRIETSNRTGINNKWEQSKEGKWLRGTPQTETSSVDTASFDEDAFDDVSVPETPSPRKHVKSRGRSRQEYDQPSPLGSVKLDYGLDA